MVKVAYFDKADIQLSDSFDPTDARACDGLEAFLALGPEDRLGDSGHVFAYYQDFRDAIGGEDWLDEEMGLPESPEHIWSFVQPKTLGVWKGHGADDHYYVFLEANCGWDEEHGLLLVWRNGRTLVKAGGFDGHATNESAYADESMRDVVYRASNPAYTTRLDTAKASDRRQGPGSKT